MSCPITPHVERLVDLALEEDLGRGDLTTRISLPHQVTCRGEIIAKEELVACGMELAAYVFVRVDPAIRFTPSVRDGDRVPQGTIMAVATGSATGLLSAERLALNFLMRLSGVATLTSRFVHKSAEAGTKARIVDTRKTTPGYRVLEKYAVLTGGGFNHRMDLGSGVLIKDNHIVACGSVSNAVQNARKSAPHTVRIQVEVRTLEELDQALDAKADAVLLDNMEIKTMAEAVRRTAGRLLIEASGNVDEQSVADIASTGVDLISVGRLTHSARAVDISMDMRSTG